MKKKIAIQKGEDPASLEIEESIESEKQNIFRDFKVYISRESEEPGPNNYQKMFANTGSFSLDYKDYLKPEK